MHIQHVEIGNFRKLKAVRVDFATEKTVFVGANNSGKTSAMDALRRFLVDPTAFTITDLTLSNWKALNEAGDSWEAASIAERPIPPINWNDVLPFLDVWLHVEMRELHHVQQLLPTLDWTGGILGVRLRFEPKDADVLQTEYLKARKQVATTLSAGVPPVVIVSASAQGEGGGVQTAASAAPAGLSTSLPFTISLWPKSMVEFLERRLRAMFAVQAYLLDPTKLRMPADGQATPQTLSPDASALDGDPFKGLISIDEIRAQRGFGQIGKVKRLGEEDDQSDRGEPGNNKRLSAQLRSYYANHLDPYDTPEPQDLEALQALEGAAVAFDTRLKACFATALKELEDLGYPGITDPKLTISTRIRPTDGLRHDAAVQYEVPTFASVASMAHRLPEDSNGLGYQNLVSMVFGLMSFRDSWMKVGKAGASRAAAETATPPLHLVLVEEPEAHLHAQVQQVFIKQAYAVLRNHDKLRASEELRTQLVVSTHSSHVAHACDFASLRYFRRLAAPALAGSVPIASVVNLSEVFGTSDRTDKFVTRYLKISHCDLFFADAAVLVEGPAERILVPHFVEERAELAYLRRCYLTWLEIGGSHAHRLRQLIEHLGITTLIITDIDAKDGATGASVPPKRQANQKARNETLKTWVPATDGLDVLLDKPAAEKVKQYPSGYGVRVSYQAPIQTAFKTETPSEALANTFEDALAYQNIAFFTGRPGIGLTAKFRDAIANSANLGELADKLHAALKTGGKAEFALDLLYSDDINALAIPTYILEGLLWVIEQLKRKERELEPAEIAG